MLFPSLPFLEVLHFCNERITFITLLVIGALIGCSAGFLNSVKIKGTHTAMKSGMLLADVLVRNFTGEFPDGYEAKEYESVLHSSWVADELKVVRNSHASFRWGLLPGMLHTAFSCFVSSMHFE